MQPLPEHHQPAVTVIVPVFNGRQLLHNAIDSVMAQSQPDWQMVLIDDASTDGSGELVDAYIDQRIVRRLHNSRNVGLYASVNRAVSHVGTEWVVILHQDDELAESYLEEMMSLVAQHPDVDGFWAQQDIIDVHGKYIEKRQDTNRLVRIQPGRESWLSGLQRGCFWIGSGSLTRTSLLKARPFRPDLPHCADYEWFLGALRTSCFVYYEKALVRLRRHALQASAHNLASGRDVREYYQVIHRNIRQCAFDLSVSDTCSISWHWMKIVGWRAASAAVRGRHLHAAWLATWAVRFMLLGLGVSRWRAIAYSRKCMAVSQHDR